MRFSRLDAGDTAPAASQDRNLTQRLQQWAEPGETVLSEPTCDTIEHKPGAYMLEQAMVKGRDTAVGAYRFPPRTT